MHNIIHLYCSLPLYHTNLRLKSIVSPLSSICIRIVKFHIRVRSCNIKPPKKYSCKSIITLYTLPRSCADISMDNSDAPSVVGGGGGGGGTKVVRESPSSTSSSLSLSREDEFLRSVEEGLRVAARTIYFTCIGTNAFLHTAARPSCIVTTVVAIAATRTSEN